MTTLHLIPVGLGDSPPDRWLPRHAQEIAVQLRHFIAENAKSARAFLKQLETAIPLAQIDIQVLRADTGDAQIRHWLQGMPAGADLGLVSEAGCPAVADPGARVVAQAHALGIRVVPWTGPSSIMLGLMASGLQGQRFAFHGYAPIKAPERDACLRRWETESRRQSQTQILIETPYRNAALFDALLRSLHPGTRLCVASALTCADEAIMTRSIAQWRQNARPDLDRKPTLFLFLAS
ncbi:SAM-dependent methyltransferase [Castellaniella sp.]|uniref:SAM-dependent methyltransferase n=1 Tax=Castellaniella sp. TaxID=1955812 RepID=UPI00355F5093